MYLIVGLGNPEKKYFNTFHNLGFMVADKVAEKLGAEFNKGECCAVTAHTRVGGQKVIIAKPVTYMNLSGQAVLELVNKYKIERGNLLVAYDDVDIPMGSLRLRKDGSAGTHNGMRNIVKELKTENFARVRIGFHPEGEDLNIPLINLVLSGIREKDAELFKKAVDSAAQAAAEFANGSPVQDIMQKHNGANK